MKRLLALFLLVFTVLPYIALASGTLYESFTASPDGQSAVASNQWIAQSWTTTSSHSLGSVKLNVFKTGTPTDTWTIGVYATSGGKPTGSALCSTTADPSTFTTSTSGAVVEFILSGCPTLSNATVYAIQVSSNGGSNPNWGLIRHVNGGGYPNGQAYYSSDNGSTWLADGPGGTADNYFEIYGAVSSTPAPTFHPQFF